MIISSFFGGGEGVWDACWEERGYADGDVGVEDDDSDGEDDADDDGNAGHETDDSDDDDLCISIVCLYRVNLTVYT